MKLGHGVGYKQRDDKKALGSEVKLNIFSNFFFKNDGQKQIKKQN